MRGTTKKVKTKKLLRPYLQANRSRGSYNMDNRLQTNIYLLTIYRATDEQEVIVMDNRARNFTCLMSIVLFYTI